MHGKFRKEYELAHEQLRAERRAERDRCIAELDARYERLVAEFDERNDRLIAEFGGGREEQRRGFDSVTGGLANGRQVMREMLLEIREGRKALLRLQADQDDIGDAVRANTHGLLRVLDELRREDGPSAAGA
jgi:hypothetical protein